MPEEDAPDSALGPALPAPVLSVWQAAFLGAATLSAFGILEWALFRPVAPLDLGVRALGSVILVHGAIGLGAGLAAQLWSQTRGSLSGVVAASLVSLLPAAVFVSGGGLRGAAIGALAAVALLEPARRLLERLPTPLRLTASRLAKVHGVVLAAAVVLLGFHSAEGRVPWAAVVVAGLAAVALIERRGLWANTTGAAALALLFWMGPPAPALEGTAPEGAPSVLLVTLDTLRADKLGFQGHEAAETPTLDALAAEGRWFAHAQSLSSWTGPSHLTILSGRTPASHGVLLNGRALPASVPTLGSLLSASGWHTGAFVAGFPVQARTLGLRQAFHRYDDRFEGPGLEAFGSTIAHGVHRKLRGERPRRWRRSAADVNAAALPWLAQERSQPFFTWVHYYDPHLPYEQLASDGPTDGRWYALTQTERGQVAGSPTAMAHMAALYDAQVTYVDRHLGEVARAARRASGDNLWIVVTADHGESFGEHGLYFNREAYEVTGRVPLILVPPKGTPLEGGRDDRLVGLHDLAPTLLGVLGLPVPEGTDGVDFLTGDLTDGRAILKWHEPEEPGSYGRAISVRRGHYRLVRREPGWRGRTRSNAETELYDLATDPAEARDLAATGHPAEAELRGLLPQGSEDGGSASSTAPLDDETRQALKALGYLD